MDPLSSFLDRLSMASSLLGGVFVIGFLIAWGDPDPKVILTLAIGLSCGMLLLGPYAAAALYTTRLQHVWHGHLRWPLCLILAVSSVVLLDSFLHWSTPQLVLAAAVATVGTVFGHDASLAVLELRRSAGQVDPWMVGLFPALVGLAALAGYCSLGFAIGAYQVTRAFVG
ncbi:MAG: hypothetical protein HOC05_13165 [Gemmatimonadetes bacterium]|nr:hypothetical protein [Gemmatimonadota bacterium]MBT5964630.1 hypothetical protein [Gemmatimonadota bacterium]MBT6629452.1 hypothetical protein [Gemmatimonadota bacterium]MBT7457478.1 hypothetical protein [Gemmatimonadota bacterium]